MEASTPARVMDTDDDIFIIHKRALAYIEKQEKLRADSQEQQNQLMTKMLSSVPPHGFTPLDWKTYSKRYGVAMPDTPSHKLTYKECRDIIKQCSEIDELRELELNKIMYESTARSILDKYKRSINNVIHADFMNTTKQHTVSPEQIRLRDLLITEIENLFGSAVVDQVVTRRVQQGTTRMEVETNFDVEQDDNDDNWSGMVYNDINRVNFIQRFKYDKKQHFSETIKQLQGLQHKHIPQDVIDTILDMILKHGLADLSKSNPKDRYSRVTKAHIRMFLEESKFSAHYEDTQLIYNKITTNPCPNIQKYEKALLEDFQALVDVYCNLPSDITHNRCNCLNSHYLLRQLLKRRGVYLAEDDLNNIKTPSRIRDHDEIYQICCERLGWNFTPSD